MQQPPAAPPALEAELQRLKHSNAALERSITELKQALATDGADLDYRQAIHENVVLLAKQRARVASLEAELARTQQQPAAAATTTAGPGAGLWL